MKPAKLSALGALLLVGLSGAAFAQQQPMADAGAMQNPAVKSPDRMSGAALAKGHNSFTRGEARARLQKAGYAQVADLTLDPDGLWQATALWSGHRVHVALDFKGNVAAR